MAQAMRVRVPPPAQSSTVADYTGRVGLGTTKGSTLRVRLVIGAPVFLAIVAGTLFAVWLSRPQSVHTRGVAVTQWIEYRQFPGG